jgi:hypothetical protein
MAVTELGKRAITATHWNVYIFDFPARVNYRRVN